MTEKQRLCAVIAALLVAGFFLGGTVAEHGLFSNEMAAWIQGIGTIGALAAAIAISRQEARRGDRRAIQRQIILMNTGLSAFLNLCAIIEVLGEKLEQMPPDSKFTIENWEPSLNISVSWFSNVPIFEYESSVFVKEYEKHFICIPRLIDDTNEMFKVPRAQAVAECKLMVDDLTASMRIIRAEIAEYRRRLAS